MSVGSKSTPRLPLATPPLKLSVFDDIDLVWTFDDRLVWVTGPFALLS